MEIRQLRALVTILEEGTFTAAAARMHYTQQALSRQIADLERSLGRSLLVRGPSGVTPTADGLAVVSAAREVLALCDGIARAGPGGDRQDFVVGVFAPAGWLLLPWLARWARGQQRQLRVVPVLWEEQVEWLVQDRVDLVLTYAPVSVASLRCTPLWSEPTGVWGSPELVDDLTFDRFLTLPTWQMPRADRFSREVWCAYEPRGGPPQFRTECFSMEDVALAAAGGELVGLAPMGAPGALALPGTEAVPLPGLLPAVGTVVTRRCPSAPTREAVTWLQEILHRLPPPAGVELHLN